MASFDEPVQNHIRCYILCVLVAMSVSGSKSWCTSRQMTLPHMQHRSCNSGLSTETFDFRNGESHIMATPSIEMFTGLVILTLFSFVKYKDHVNQPGRHMSRARYSTVNWSSFSLAPCPKLMDTLELAITPRATSFVCSLTCQSWCTSWMMTLRFHGTPSLHSAGSTETLNFRIGEVRTQDNPAKPSIEMFTGLAIRILIRFINCPRRHVGHEAHHEWRPCLTSVLAFWRSNWNPTFQNRRGPAKPSIEMLTGAAIRRLFLIVKWKLQSHKPSPEEHVSRSHHEHSKEVGDLTRALLWQESASSPSVLRDNFWNIDVARICNRTTHTRWWDNLDSTQLR